MDVACRSDGYNTSLLAAGKLDAESSEQFHLARRGTDVLTFK